MDLLVLAHQGLPIQPAPDQRIFDIALQLPNAAYAINEIDSRRLKDGFIEKISQSLEDNAIPQTGQDAIGELLQGPGDEIIEQEDA